MSFDEYMESKIPGYIDFISKEKIDELAKLYSEYIISSNASLENLKQQFNTKVGLDYSTDFNKNQTRTMNAKQNLDSKISQIQQQIGIKEEKNNSMTW